MPKKTGQNLHTTKKHTSWHLATPPRANQIMDEESRPVNTLGDITGDIYLYVDADKTQRFISPHILRFGLLSLAIRLFALREYRTCATRETEANFYLSGLNAPVLKADNLLRPTNNYALPIQALEWMLNLKHHIFL